ncbi:MAG TPA: hypothetical protein K8V21_08455 [Weissella thailandensis]|uniref:hypothetical protein n=1 Tax=Weissella thailandensis TaxID=89061 RepID=UPI001D1D1E2D|nr:hypothetical protein [Weissella thailandensis]HJG85396.1 hypothetical protein [Weissella thailandensis]
MHKTIETISKSKNTTNNPILHSVHITPDYLVTTDRHVLIMERFKTQIDNFTGELTIDPEGKPLLGNYPNTERLIPEYFNYRAEIDADKWIDIVQVYKKNAAAEITIENGYVFIAFQDKNGKFGERFDIGKSESENITIAFNPKFLKMVSDYGKEVIGRNFNRSTFELNIKSKLEPATVNFENKDIMATFLITPMRVYND